MEEAFWLKRWEENDIGFHLEDVNPQLQQHIEQLGLAAGSRIFVPLCGKTRDIHWLLAQGFKVVGIELCASAVQQLFDELGVVFEERQVGDLVHRQCDGLDIYQGDLFALNADVLGKVDAIYDRAALVALPLAMRQPYSQHLLAISHTAPQLLNCWDYRQSDMPGPPFSISDTELLAHYGKHYRLRLLFSAPVEGGLKGLCEATEKTWLLESLAPLSD